MNHDEGLTRDFAYPGSRKQLLMLLEGLVAHRELSEFAKMG